MLFSLTEADRSCNSIIIIFILEALTSILLLWTNTSVIWQVYTHTYQYAFLGFGSGFALVVIEHYPTGTECQNKNLYPFLNVQWDSWIVFDDYNLGCTILHYKHFLCHFHNQNIFVPPFPYDNDKSMGSLIRGWNMSPPRVASNENLSSFRTSAFRLVATKFLT